MATETVSGVALDSALLRAASEALPVAPDEGMLRAALVAAVGLADAPSWPTGREVQRLGPWGVREGRAFLLEVGPGTVGVRAVDEARTERRRDNPDDVPVRFGTDAAVIRATADGDVLEPARLRILPDWLRFSSRDYPPAAPRRRTRAIMEWSYRSRARMLRTFADLDYGPMRAEGGCSAMVTLTYPGDWRAVVPSRVVLNRQVEALRRRWGRAFLGGRRPAGLWKLEFQRRGAPHLHMFVRVRSHGPDADCRVPEHCGRDGRTLVDVCRCVTFEQWLSRTWADVVAADVGSGEYGRHLAAGTGVDFATRTTDPKRLAVYFLKHGTKAADGKEYQNSAPRDWLCDDDGVIGADDGTGRFWGVWGLRRVRVAVYVDARTYYALRRQLRRFARREGRKLRCGQLGVGGSNGGGWMLANDGPGLALDAADRARALLVEP